MTHHKLYLKIQNQKHASAWSKGVSKYALELVEMLEQEGWETKEKNMLNGASNWRQFSYGGSALIYNEEIAERLCSPSEFKKKKGGNLPPNKCEQWLDIQARALLQAARLVISAATNEG